MTGHLKVAVLLAGLLLIFVALPAPAQEPPEEPLPVGATAPDFSVATLEGNQVSLSGWRGHVVVLNYFITWYRDAARHLGVMESLATKYSPQGLRLLSISLDEGQSGRDATAAFITERNIAHPVVADPDQAIASRYGVRALPAIFIIDAQGRIARYHEGYMEGDETWIESMISEVLAAAPAGETATAPEETPADQEPVCHCFKQQEQ